MRIVERPGVLTAYELSKTFVLGIAFLGIAAGTTIMHVTIAPQIVWEEPWRISIITAVALFATLLAERRTFIVDANQRIFTLVKKRAFSTREESIPFEAADRFEYLASRVGITVWPTLHLAHDRGMLHIFGQGRDSMSLSVKDAERIAAAAGLELEQRRR